MHGITRRQLLQSIGALAPLAIDSRAAAQPGVEPLPEAGPLPSAVLPRGVRARLVDNVNGIRMHVLEAGFEGARRPAVLLVHGFPELAYSWRKVMLPIAAAGYHVVAPDLRGYGRSGGTGVKFDDDLRPWRTLNEVTDMVALVSALGYRSVAAVVGHDFGSPVAGVVLCRAAGHLPIGRADERTVRRHADDAVQHGGCGRPPSRAAAADTIYDDLAKLSPPRKHYQRYYSTREANENMWHAPQGIACISARLLPHEERRLETEPPAPLAARTAAEWAKLPRYYVMDLNKGMAETVAPEMPSPRQIAANTWLPDAELRVYSGEYGRTGFQGGLQWYRVGSSGRFNGDLQVFAGRTIDQPSMFIAGTKRLGRVSESRRAGADAEDGVHAHGRRAFRRRRRALGPAGAAGTGQRTDHRVSAAQRAAPGVPGVGPRVQRGRRFALKGRTYSACYHPPHRIRENSCESFCSLPRSPALVRGPRGRRQGRGRLGEAGAEHHHHPRHWGIPHVYGKTDADAVFGVIYAQAEDDFNRVETNFINSHGPPRRGRRREGDLPRPADEALHRSRTT